MLAVRVPQCHHQFVVEQWPEPSIRMCRTSYQFHQSIWMHPSIPVVSIRQASGASAETPRCTAVLFRWLCPSPSRIDHLRSACPALALNHRNLAHPPHGRNLHDHSDCLRLAVTRDCCRVTANEYSRVPMRLRSLVIILPIHPYLISLDCTFATVYHNYHSYSYQAECWHMCPYTIIASSVNGYVALTAFREFTPVSEPQPHVTIKISTFQIHFGKHDHCRAWSLNQFNIRLSQEKAPVLSSETNWCIARVTSNDDDDHNYRPRLFTPADERNQIRSRCCVKHHFSKSIESDHQPEKLQWMQCIAGNKYDYHKYSIRPYQPVKSNTIPTSHLTAIISRRTFIWLCKLTPEAAILITEREVKRVRASCTPTTRATSQNLGGQQRERQIGKFQKHGNNKRNVRPSISEPGESTSGDSNHSNDPDTGNSISVKSNKPSGLSHVNSSPVLWFSKEVDETWKANRRCTRCGSRDYKWYRQTTFTRQHAASQRTNPQPCTEYHFIAKPT